MHLAFRWRCAFLIAMALALGCSPARAGLDLRGFIDTHDPSTMIECDGRYYVFYTGQGILSKSSADKLFWSPGPAVFSHAPAWTTNAVPGFAGIFWAPDVFFWNGRYFLYYAVSTFGSQVSAIGLATNETLNPSDPSYRWVDQGRVISSGNGSPYNTIDPSFCRDGAGNLWMAFGSYWNGIYLTQLNSNTGLRISASSPTYHLAYNSSIEASYLLRRGGYYYLWANWGSCCSGVNSTYNIRVGRATSITGPYLDKDGVDMANNGGSLFLEGTGKYVGPGHVGILRENGVDWLTYHYYDAGAWSPGYNAFGDSKLDLMPLNWTQDNWPVATNDWEAVHLFHPDARDENGQYYGLLMNGAAAQPDPIHGRSLVLNGSNQFVRLPVGEAYGRTYEAVVKWSGGPAWQRIFDFGTDTNHWLFLTPYDGSAMQFAITDNRLSYVQTIEAPSPLPANQWVNVAVTLNGSQGILYLNGQPWAVNPNMTTSPLDVRAQTNYLGRSRWPADPYFRGSIASFRAYGRVLSPDEIIAPQPIITSPPDGGVFYPGTMVSFGGAARDFMATPLGASDFSWTIYLAKDGVTNIAAGPFDGVTNGAFDIPATVNNGTYLIALTVTDSAGRRGSVTRLLAPAHPPPVVDSYYSFRADASDARGHFNGALEGGAAIQNDPTRGNVLNLSGNGQYVSLPPGASSFRTFMGWVKWNGGAAWQRIFDFGDDTNRYTVLTPMAADGKLRHNISINSIPGEEINDGPGPLPTGVWTHVAVVMDGRAGVLYTNGVPVATNLFLELTPSDVGGPNNFLGKSHFPADPYFSGEFSSFRLFSVPLSAAQINAPVSTIAQPLFGSLYQPGQSIPFSGSAADFNDTALAGGALSWVIEYHSGTAVTVVSTQKGTASGLFSIPPGGSSSNSFYRFNLLATDGSGRVSTNYADIFPASLAAAGGFASFYPFASGAMDSSNVNDGSFVNGASIISDPERGNVANLNGLSQYVKLPPGAGGFASFSGWVKWRGGAPWQRVLDFGNNTSQFVFLTPRDSSGDAQAAITDASGTYVQTIEASSPLPVNTWVHVGLVFDGRQGILYENGQAIAVNNSVNLLPSDLAPANCWFGRSQYAADPFFNGEIDSFYLNAAPLPLEDLLGNAAPAMSYRLSTSGLTLSWPNWSGELGLFSATNLAPPINWTMVNPSGVTNGIATAQIPPSGAAEFFEVAPLP